MDVCDFSPSRTSYFTTKLKSIVDGELRFAISNLCVLTRKEFNGKPGWAQVRWMWERTLLLYIVNTDCNLDIYQLGWGSCIGFAALVNVVYLIER